MHKGMHARMGTSTKLMYACTYTKVKCPSHCKPARPTSPNSKVSLKLPCTKMISLAAKIDQDQAACLVLLFDLQCLLY